DGILKHIIKKLLENKDFAYKQARFKEENNWPDYLFYEEIAKIIRECKNYSILPKDIAKRCKKERNEDIVEFYRLFYVIYYKYRQFMFQNKFYDFSDLILKTVTLLKDKPKLLKYYQNKFKYILVDEFQDVNYPQVQLITLLKGQNNNLFAVGDDWQAIYGWRGSDVDFILKFKKIFKENHKIITLPYNYRSDSHIVNAASRFIRKNRHQCRKKIKSHHPKSSKIKVFRGKDEEDNLKFVNKAIKKILKYGISQENIMILGRNWKHLNIYINNLPKLGFKDIKINTIHGSKGLESNIVFLVGLHKGRGGFPHVKEDHEIMKIIKKTPLNLRLEEERRCFYVGVTRACKLLFLITEKDNESQFLHEIPKRYCQEVK
ncbi:MAG: UvrD-helicase domain-containing protein, partial [Parcubacteria group bacterium]|nr:UvrD-helicase domain-containing protein [Parcubacteria group bacterium]